MIIQIRGTSGSGKSTAMRQVMERIGEWDSVKVASRKQPLYYRTFLPSPWGKVVVLGHYETACGGCDTVGSAQSVYHLLQDIREAHGDIPVLMEGLLLSEDVKWTLQMAAKEPVRVYFLTTPLEKCLEQIGKRRAEKGNADPVDPKNTTNRVKTIYRAKTKLEEAGVWTRFVSFGQCVDKVLEDVRHAHRR